MGQRFTALTEKHIQFIQSQQLFFVGTAMAYGRVNISPKGMDTLRVIDQNKLIWLNVTGSGNETSAHVQVNPRMTLMFCAFQGDPLILRLYGTAEVVHTKEETWQQYYVQFPPNAGARQIFVLTIDLVQTSCGMAVPYYSYVGERELLNHWAVKMGPQGIAEYWSKKNQFSLDGAATKILEKS